LRSPPRLPKELAPRIRKETAIPDDADSMPDEIEYDETKHRLMIGKGFIDNVPAAVQARRVPTRPLAGRI
jgi:hypothetical protein